MIALLFLSRYFVPSLQQAKLGWPGITESLEYKLKWTLKQWVGGSQTSCTAAGGLSLTYARSMVTRYTCCVSSMSQPTRKTQSSIPPGLENEQ